MEYEKKRRVKHKLKFSSLKIWKNKIAFTEITKTGRSRFHKNDRELCFGYSGLLIRHLNGDDTWTTGYMSLQFKTEVWDRDKNLGFNSI